MKKGYFLSFVIGVVFALSITFLVASPLDSITGYAVANNSSLESDNISMDEPSQPHNWYISDAFRDDNATIFSAACRPNAFIINDTVTKWLCSLYYNDKIEIRRVSNTGSMWPNLIGGGYVLINQIRDMDQLSVGDIIIVNEDIFGTEVVHRIVEKNRDGEGYYVITSGDNAMQDDNTTLRLEHIVAKVVGVLY